jgi:hypothetical protein
MVCECTTDRWIRFVHGIPDEVCLRRWKQTSLG